MVTDRLAPCCALFLLLCCCLCCIVSEFRRVADTLLEGVPGLEVATDIIAGFPGELGMDVPLLTAIQERPP